MSTNLKVIKYTAIVSVVFLIATFFVCLNISYQWFDIKWMPNEFLLTISGGIFSSTMVVLLCEIQKYLINKRNSENALFDCCTRMLAYFISAKSMLTRLQENKDENIPTGMLNEFQQNVKYQLSFYFNIDYTTCRKEQTLYVAHSEFAKFLIDTVQKVAYDVTYLDIAVITQKLESINSTPSTDRVTAKDIIVARTIAKLVEELTLCIDQIADFCEKIDYSKRYKFKERFTQKVKNSELKMRDLEDFLGQK